jgi:HK97 family phage prohead protease
MNGTKFQLKSDPAVDTKAGAVPLDLKAVAEDGEFEGYLSTFGNVDRGMDMVMPGAFRRTLKERKLSSIKLLRDHDTRKVIGKWLSMEEDDRGLKVRGKLFAGTVQLATETLALMREGALDAMSIGYRTIKAQWDEEQGVRKLLDLDLWEGSIVTFPMNEMATVDAVKNDLTITDVERILREGGAPGAFAKLVAIHGFEGATKRLGSRREGGESGKSIAEMIRETSANMKGMAK